MWLHVWGDDMRDLPQHAMPRHRGAAGLQL
jgi:hypothetical protein